MKSNGTNDPILELDELIKRMRSFFEMNPAIGRELYNHVYHGYSKQAGQEAKSKPEAKQKPDQKQKIQLRVKALRLYDAGGTCAEVGKQLGVSTMTVSAWVAHRTMGTYAD